jgi:hypothetical protein
LDTHVFCTLNHRAVRLADDGGGRDPKRLAYQ